MKFETLQWWKDLLAIPFFAQCLYIITDWQLLYVMCLGSSVIDYMFILCNPHEKSTCADYKDVCGFVLLMVAELLLLFTRGQNVVDIILLSVIFVNSISVIFFLHKVQMKPHFFGLNRPYTPLTPSISS